MHVYDAPARARMHALPYTWRMRLLEALASAFINTFGITQPTEGARRRAAWFILVMMAITLAIVCAVGYAFYAALHRSA